MKLTDLIATDAPGVRGVSAGSDPVEITQLAYDSRSVEPGALFFCVPGFQSDGHDFAAQAIRAGVRALVVERPLGLGVPEVLVESTRAAMGPLAARFYEDPTSELRVVGVTGTNGKTTISYLVRALLEACGERCGLLGTVKSVIAGSERPALRTTPEAIELQRDFREMLDGGDRACAMEVSSHALALGRAEAIHFAAAIFTNLTQDHLDFHPTMEDYFQAKRRLFVPGRGVHAGSTADAREGATAGQGKEVIPETGAIPGPGTAVVNVDDPYGRRLAQELEHVVTFGIDSEARYRAREVRIDAQGSRFEIDTPAGRRSLELPLPGRFNVSNALGALAACHSLGCDLDTLLDALQQGVRVPGRLEPVEEGQDFAVLVDYAHTPDSLENVLNAMREVTGGRVICVFGAGGDRDRAKRPLMGEIAGRLADVAIVTSDNPRSEDPQEIVAQVLGGARRAERPAGAPPVQAEVDRRVAIERAIDIAGGGDVVVIAGKGHERGQELAGGVKIPFDDVAVAREALRASTRVA
jgi:UDP-N-acetylmuramoyl-L-alanyl-D-glutamate--2,6-diaminopimelate ligase